MSGKHGGGQVVARSPLLLVEIGFAGFACTPPICIFRARDHANLILANLPLVRRRSYLSRVDKDETHDDIHAIAQEKAILEPAPA